jgi:hypothetical protein
MIRAVPVFGVVSISLGLSILATLSPGRDLGGYVAIPIFGWAVTSIAWLVTISSGAGPA